MEYESRFLCLNFDMFVFRQSCVISVIIQTDLKDKGSPGGVLAQNHLQRLKGIKNKQMLTEN